MLCRHSTLRHPTGTVIKTPLLVPSFSSKGFRMDKEGNSEVSDALQTCQEAITEAMLLSAYDLGHHHIPYDFGFMPEIIIVDSGGYEVSDEHDLSAVWRYKTEIKKWDLDQYRSVLNTWPKHVPSIFVSYDNRAPQLKQIEAARELFKDYPDHLHDFLLKPETPTQTMLKVENISPFVEELSAFDIIGVTEKELGNSLLNRMLALAKLRRLLDNHKINAPIHVFGSLDPITSSLYFLAGAEIFDGLTWLRYSYWDGKAIYYQNFAATIGVHVREDRVLAKSLFDNIYFLQELKYQMIDFIPDKDFTKFKFNSEILKQAYDRFRGEGGEG
ncbi:MAG: hypothetical protein GX660_21190 [Clostridiaceae bacterium]|nr:hypothetical protein [Clostridiaceae bacterium]